MILHHQGKFNINAHYLMVLLSLLFICSPSMAESKTPVRFCVPNADVYPFFLYADNKVSGINPDLMQAAFEKTPLQHANLEFVHRPWKRCNMELRAGSVDMIIGSYEKERDQVGVYPNELGFDLQEMVFSTADVCFVSVKGLQMQKTLRGMAGEIPFSVGVEAGFSQDHKPEIHPEWLVIFNHLEKYRLLQKGRVDAIVQVCSMDKFPIATKAETSGYQDFVTLQPPYLSNPAYIIYSDLFAAKHPGLAKLILQEVQKVDKQQVYQGYRSETN